MEKEYDLIAVGTGEAGSAAAHMAASKGLKTAIVDFRKFGGTCALRGCDPKKVITGQASIIADYNRLLGKGMPGSGLKLDWQRLIGFKRTFTDPIPAEAEKRYEDEGIDIYHGKASFYDDKTISVEGSGNLVGKKILIATGSKPKNLDIPGQEHLITSERFMESEHLPESIIFVGGGYISFEFGHAAKRAGSNVTILHRDRLPLKGFDPDLVNMLVESTKKDGIDVQLDAEVIEIQKQRDSFRVTAMKEGVQQSFTAGMVVHGAGRVPEIEELELKRGNVTVRDGGIAVDRHMRSVSNPRVYAAGDCVSEGMPLTPVAKIQGEAAGKNIIEGDKYEVDYSGIPTVVFSIPKLASVGIAKDSIRERDEVVFKDKEGWYESRRLSYRYAASKIIIESGSGKIVGAHILGHGAEEVINFFALAIRLGLTRGQLEKVIYAYPSMSSEIRYMLRE